MKRLSRWTAVCLVVLGCSAERASAQDYPAQSVTIVAPSAPGGMYSLLARLIGAKLERLYGQVLHRREPPRGELGDRRGLSSRARRRMAIPS